MTSKNSLQAISSIEGHEECDRLSRDSKTANHHFNLVFG